MQQSRSEDQNHAKLPAVLDGTYEVLREKSWYAFEPDSVQISDNFKEGKNRDAIDTINHWESKRWALGTMLS